jgi:hypothetical protein
MTAARKPRSPALFVGSTSGTSANVQSAGHSFMEVFREAAHVPLPLAGRAPLQQGPHLVFDLLDSPPQGSAVAVLLELLPGVENVPGDLEPVEAERLLRSQAEGGVEGEVAAQMRPADLPALRLEAVAGAEAIRADYAIEAVADEAVQVPLAAVGRDLR